MSRTIADSEADIAANPNWAKEVAILTYLTALANEKISIQQPTAGKYEFILIENFLVIVTQHPY